MATSKQTAPAILDQMRAVIFQNDKGTPEEHAFVNSVFSACSDFLANNKLVKPGMSMDQQPGMASFNDEASLANLSNHDLDALVEKAMVPANMRNAAKDAVLSLLAKARACHGSDELFRTQHFSHGSRTGINEAALQSNIQTFFAPSLFGTVTNVGLPSQEAFGASIDKVLPDIRASMAVTLLQFHRGMIDRILHRRTSASPYVKYVVPYAEVYDMLKSNDADHKVRNEGDHITPFIDLYGDPRQVSNILQPIIPLIANDTDGVLVADGVVKFNAHANLFDLSVLPNQLGKTHYNYTDLVSENVILDQVVLEVSDGTTTEMFSVPMSGLNQSRLQMQPNTVDSGIRMAMIPYTYALGSKSKTITGEDSTLLAKCTESDFLKVSMSLSVQINIKYADVEGYGYVTAAAYNKNGAQVAADVAALAESLTVTLKGYTLDARYSEENLRKSNLAIRSHVRTFDFEISNGRNILIDYSFEEELPEYLMSLVTEATSLGQDHRGLDVIVKQMMHVFDVTRLENQAPEFRSRLEKIGFQYVSSQMVRPVVYMNTIDIENVDTLRSGDYMGDIRAYVEWELLTLTALWAQNTFYRQQLRPGESIVFKCLTSEVILSCLFAVEHYHNHLNKETPSDGNAVDYTRVLPNGIVLQLSTVTYQYFRDKILLIPYREQDPESILNWGHNFDYGTFVANYVPLLDNAANKRIFSNSRSMVLPTNPSGLYLQVGAISKLVDMFQVSAPMPHGTELPSPKEVMAEE